MAPEADTRLKPRLKSGGAGETTVLLSWKPQSNEPHNPTFEPRYLTLTKNRRQGCHAITGLKSIVEYTDHSR
jgi:hypothetical protein